MSNIILGRAGKKDISIHLKTLLVSRLLLTANSGGGKSWALRRLAEQLFGKVQTIVIDPEGEFFTLREKYGYVLVGEGGETAADPRSAAMLAERLLELRASAVCDLYEAFRSKPGDRRQWVRNFLNALIDAPRKLWHPLVVIVDEAHKFCPQESPKAASMVEREIITGCKDAMVALATTGRKRGFAAVWATQRLAKLDKDASGELHNRLVGLTFEDVDVDRAYDLMSVAKEEKKEFRNSLRLLEPGQFYAFGRAITKERVLLQIGPVQTTHPESGAQKLSLPPPAPKAIAHLLPRLADLPKEAEEKQKTVADLTRQLREAKTTITNLTRSGQAQAAAAKTTGQVDGKIVKEQISKALAKRDDEWRASCKKFTEGVKQQWKLAHEATIATMHAAGKEFQKLKFDAPGNVTINITPSPRNFLLNAMNTEHVKRAVKHAVTKAATDFVNGDANKIAPGAVRILQSVARWWPKGVTEAQVATQVSMARSGGTFKTYKSKLNTAGFVRIEGKLWFATQEGMDFLGDNVPDAPTTTEEVVALWKPRLAPGAFKIFDIIRAANGDELDVEEVAGAVEMSANGGTFKTYLSHLNTVGLIVRSNKGKTVAANKETLFL